ncbi:MAG: DUF72 domain-containing protein [Beijerinckiaceae bacterium]|nr:DUF72 domain-containing protein [Beijerinckiaceae bacterium]
MAKTGRILIGVGGWTYAPWRGEFYPDGLTQKRELEYASSKLTTIEINGTYYGTQKPASFAKWRDETPDDFVFCLKGSRYTTNRRVLAQAGDSIKRFIDSGVSELRHKLGPINWQFMPTKKFDPADFEAFLGLLPKTIDGVALRHAVEVRHDSFRTVEFVTLARKYGVAIVVAGDSGFPLIPDVTAPFVYARIMGTAQSRPKGYAPKALDAWAARAKIWAAGGAPDDLEPVSETSAKTRKARDVFLFVISGYKARNPAAAMALIARL